MYYISNNEIPNHFTSTFFAAKGVIHYSHSKGNLFTCEDNRLPGESSPVISLVFIYTKKIVLTAFLNQNTENWEQ